MLKYDTVWQSAYCIFQQVYALYVGRLCTYIKKCIYVLIQLRIVNKKENCYKN